MSKMVLIKKITLLVSNYTTWRFKVLKSHGGSSVNTLLHSAKKHKVNDHKCLLKKSINVDGNVYIMQKYTIQPVYMYMYTL